MDNRWKLIEQYGELFCAKCHSSIVCDECGDMPVQCPVCGTKFNWSEDMLQAFWPAFAATCEQACAAQDTCNPDCKFPSQREAELLSKTLAEQAREPAKFP